MTMLADNISLHLSGFDLLRNVSIEVEAGKVTAIVGPNGAGKSVLLRHLLKLETGQSGSVSHRDGLTIGYVPERFQIDPTLPMPVRRFLSLNNPLTAEAIDALAAETHCEALLERPLAGLSGGELQRVLLARALAASPQVLMLDEPAQNLDVSGQLQFYQLIEEIFENRDLSVLMVSHDLHLVMSSTRRVVCLYHHICCSGAPESVARDPEFISMFGKDMAQMMSVYQHSHNHDHDHDHDHSGEATS